MIGKRKWPSDDPSGRGQHKRHCDQNGRPGHTKERQDQFSQILPPVPPISTDMWKLVFTHQSVVASKDSASQSASYERLEFLGDAYIEIMATRLIWERFDSLPAGRLSQLRELLVKNETLGEIAVQYDFDKHIDLAEDLRSNVKQWTKVKGDVVEAYVAAVVLADDKVGGPGYLAAESWLRQLWIPKLEGKVEAKPPNMNMKVRLSQRVVSRGIKLEYRDERPMKQHQDGLQTYFIGAYITGWGYKKRHLGSGQGLNKAIAGNQAAENALQRPLTEEIAERKREYDTTMKYQVEARMAGDYVEKQSDRPTA